MKYISVITLTLLLFVSNIHAKSLTFDQVHLMPKSVEKDYFIWRFLCQGDCTASQAQQVIKEVNTLNTKLRTSYQEKTGKTAKAQPNVEKKIVTKEQRDAWLAKIASVKYFDDAIKKLQQGKKDLAITYFEKARLSAKGQYNIDRATFWLYKTTKKKIYLQRLLKSWDVNLYTLLARDIMHIKYPRTITPKLSKKNLSHYNDQNPIHWTYIKKKLYKPSTNLTLLANKYKAEESVGVYTYIMSKASHQKNIYYPMPYRDIMSQLSKKRQALIYAIARKESRFVPASVSRSFALGMMQIMPFLIKHIAKERGEEIDLNEIFNPRKAIVYANHHINYLATYLHNPLFVAYGYNGGIGFTKRLIMRSDYFRNGPYEPYLSMEKIENVEAREYGKKVMVNYVIYQNKLGIPARITPYVQVLTTPSETDSFRK
ncbi:MAG: lytic transglycosylase domain-containing protein [Epsilonproteobacteria bacterium]|nr:MAG: lytic transglycosylase domain-containing protein [Campylobacterota bacterium]